MKKWEYILLENTYGTSQTHADIPEWLAHLNSLGETGWELLGQITLFPSGNAVPKTALVAKRRKTVAH
jgi:hypothetical protein